MADRGIEAFGMQFYETFRRCVGTGHGRSRPGRAITALGCTALISPVLWMPWRALAQDACGAPIIGTATLPRDLTPWGMYLNADPVVQAVLIGLVLASIVTWTVWLAQRVRIFFRPR